jgi:hypothetical protein
LRDDDISDFKRTETYKETSFFCTHRCCARVLTSALMQAQLPLAPLVADKVPPALVMGSDADPIVDPIDIEVRSLPSLPLQKLSEIHVYSCVKHGRLQPANPIFVE